MRVVCEPLTSTSIRARLHLFITYNSYNTLAERVITVELLIVNVAIKRLAPSFPFRILQNTKIAVVSFRPHHVLILQHPHNSVWSLLSPSFSTEYWKIDMMAVNCIPAKHCNFRYSFLIISDAETSSSRSRKSPWTPRAETEDVELNPKHTRRPFNPELRRLADYYEIIDFVITAKNQLFSRIRQIL